MLDAEMAVAHVKADVTPSGNNLKNMGNRPEGRFFIVVNMLEFFRLRRSHLGHSGFIPESIFLVPESSLVIYKIPFRIHLKEKHHNQEKCYEGEITS